MLGKTNNYDTTPCFIVSKYIDFFPIQNNKLNGPAMLFMANGDRLEISYENGVVHGNATIKGK